MDQTIDVTHCLVPDADDAVAGGASRDFVRADHFPCSAFAVPDAIAAQPAWTERGVRMGGRRMLIADDTTAVRTCAEAGCTGRVVTVDAERFVRRAVFPVT